MLKPDDAVGRLCAAVDAGTMMRHLEVFHRYVKLSGAVALSVCKADGDAWRARVHAGEVPVA